MIKPSAFSQLFELLSPQRMTEIVDVGANPVDGDPPYAPMLSAGLCRVTGFEPQEQALAELQKKKGPNELYLPYAVGDGARHKLNICRASGMTSLFEPDPSVLSLFNLFPGWGTVERQVELETRRLDDIEEIKHLDFLKMDIQGGELSVFQNGMEKLSQTVAVQVEVSFVTIYRNQPAMGEIDMELRRQGFIPHCFAAVKTWPIAPCVINGDPYKPVHQLLEADMVYVRDFSRPELMSDEQLKHLALITYCCYKSLDLALRCVMHLEQRQALRTGAQQQFLQAINSPLPPRKWGNGLRNI